MTTDRNSGAANAKPVPQELRGNDSHPNGRRRQLVRPAATSRGSTHAIGRAPTAWERAA